MFWLVLIVVAILLIVVWFKSYHLDIYRSITAYTGGVGSGKTFLSVRQCVKCYKKALKTYRNQAFWAKILRREVPEKPLLFSNIPIIYKKQFTSAKLTPEIVLLQCRIPEGSVVLIDEVSGFLNQFEYAKNENVRLFDEFCRFFRQYVGGNMVINDQCSANVVLQIRRRLNTIYNLNKHRFFLGVTSVKVREINISDEIIAIDEKDTNEPYSRFVCFGNFFKFYESRCYRPRYYLLPVVEPEFHTKKQTYDLFTCPNQIFLNRIDGFVSDMKQKIADKLSADPSVSATPKERGNDGVQVEFEVVDFDPLDEE
ncbi:MAG: hypothetical protein IKA05_05375 [Clostridia bacterium]|nr:hypothetical protein [Clostridia bacterium]